MVQNGQFAKEWLLEDKKGRPLMKTLMKQWEDSVLEKTGGFIRCMSEVGKKT